MIVVDISGVHISILRLVIIGHLRQCLDRFGLFEDRLGLIDLTHLFQFPYDIDLQSIL
jgi:hypothetical protein